MTHISTTTTNDYCGQCGRAVEAGEPGTQDYDFGFVIEVEGGKARVGWDSGTQTWIDVTDLRRHEPT